jgi:hypothetical protein
MSPFLLALFVGLAALMFQLHSALKRELNEDDALQQSLLSVIDRERTSSFRAFISSLELSELIRKALQAPLSGEEWEALAETCEANLYDVAVKVYFPLSTCAELRATRTRHVVWLKRGKAITLASFVSGIAGAIACSIAISTKWSWAEWLTLLLLVVLTIEILWSLMCWYMADGRQSTLADARRRRGRRL